ncbi:hypothetical protein Tco_0717370 [Tanacetum coccineum]
MFDPAYACRKSLNPAEVLSQDVGRKDNKEEAATEVFDTMVRNMSPKVGEVIDVIDTPLPPVNARARKESNKGGGG